CATHPARAGGHDRPLEAGARRRRMILLNPGPVNVSPRVTAALARGDVCHREPEYGDLQASIRSRLLRAFAPAGGFTAVLITGSGTAALEAAVTSVLSARGRLVVVSNGVYGERIAAMAAAARLPHTVVEGAWTEPPDLAAVERALGAPDVEAVAVVHHETTTGLLNPVAEVGRLAYALDEALAELLEEGVAARVARYAAAAGLLREGFTRLGLAFVLPPVRRSNSLTSLWLPAGRTYDALHDGLKARGFVIYEGQGRLAREIFRVANMGQLARADFERFLAALTEVLGA